MPDYSSTDFPARIGGFVRSCRKMAGLTQLGLAELAGIGKTAVFEIEKGKATVRLDTLLAVLDVLSISLELVGPMDTEETGDA
ncbi:MAG: helix-turn-helix transcriptional regulator [Lentisphaeria bacterium]|nr:helix-turn-helix transcriptional regulator [Lentisphaeria bacterium]